MTFLQPLVLAALPLVALPLVIHLINQRRFQTVPWAAMMFLQAAKALSRGYSRLRHWLIMLMRMGAVAAVILAAGRPLSRGWLALAGGGRPDTALVVLDRSPTMRERDPAVPDTKLETGRRQLAETLATLGAAHCLLFVDPARPPVDVADPRSLADLPAAGPCDVPASLPLLLQAAYDHVYKNAAGTTEVWICSDQRANDWAAEDGAWGGLRDAFARLPQQVRFQLLSFAAAAPGNLAVRAPVARVEGRGADRSLVVTVTVTRGEDGPATTVPLAFEIGGVTSTVEVELAGREAVLKNHVIPLAAGAGPRGWGRVSIPPDSNAADNDFFFAFDEPAVRRSLVVTPDVETPAERAARQALALVAGIPPGKDQQADVDVVAVGALAAAPLDEVAAILWLADPPGGANAAIVRGFLERGGQAVFFPPDAPGDGEFLGFSWRPWTAHPQPLKPASWRTDEDVLANTLAGAALPVGEVEVTRSCGIAGDHVPLASLPGGLTLLGRLEAGRGGAYACATRPDGRDSTLAGEGIVLYALVQRAIDRGVAVLGRARQLDAGVPAEEFFARSPGVAWSRLAGPDAPSTEPGRHAGVFGAEDRLVAVNRPAAEDAARVLADDRIDGLFRGLSFTRISGTAGRADSLVQEIWRAFLIAMLVALIAEGILCLPRPRQARPAAATPARVEAAA
ncbi:MAG: BatA domain-containing protein [Planctomycetaceae bacterium]